MNKYEKNVAPDKVFFVSNGHILNNLKELYNEISHMSDDVFFHHVTAERHDFSTWVKDVIGEKALATKMAKAGTPVMMKELLKSLFVEDSQADTKKAAPKTKTSEPKKNSPAKKTTAKAVSKKKA